MNEPVIFTDIYPKWELAWYATPAGKFSVVAAVFVLIVSAMIFLLYWRRRTAPYRRLKKLLACVESDADGAPDAYFEAIKLVLGLQAKNKSCAHEACSCDEQVLFGQIASLPVAPVDTLLLDQCRTTLIVARYGAEKPSGETRRAWITLVCALRKAASSSL